MRLVVEQNSSWKDILDKIEYIRLHSEEYQKVKAELKNVPVETIEMMLNRYIDVYQSQPERNYNSPNIRFDNRFIVKHGLVRRERIMKTMKIISVWNKLRWTCKILKFNCL